MHDGSEVIIRQTHAIKAVDMATGAKRLLAGSESESGLADGVGAAARFFIPNVGAIAPSGAVVHVADSKNSALRQIDLSTQAVTTLTTSLGFPSGPNAVVATATTAILVGGSGIPAVMAVDLTGTSYDIVAVAGGGRGFNDGVGAAANFNNALGAALTPDGNTLLVADLEFGLRAIK